MEINILSFFEEHIYLVLLFIPLFGQLGIPSGSIFFLLFAGSLASSISWLWLLFVIGLISVVIWDILGYTIWKKLFHTSWVQKQAKRESIEKILKSTFAYFKKEGKLAIFLTRFLVVTPGPYLNYIVGIQNFDFVTFFRIVIIGEILYVSELLILGYIFQDTFEYLVDIISYLSITLITLYLIYSLGRVALRRIEN